MKHTTIFATGSKWLAFALLVSALMACQPEPAQDQALNQWRQALAAQLLNADTVRFEALIKEGFHRFNQTQSLIQACVEARKSIPLSLETRIIEATALCQQAGIETEPENQMAYLRQGMLAFDRLLDEFPQSDEPRLWMALTYANFPAFLGADSYVSELLAQLAAGYAQGHWVETPFAAEMQARAAVELSRSFELREYRSLAETTLASPLLPVAERDTLQKQLPMAAGQ